ncbi:MAG: ribonuclease J [Bdellovibrionales bacterium]|nr:ribonuclease J [Bdellovibrionales bacterium]
MPTLETSRTKTGQVFQPPEGLRILTLGGLGEIGMNCMVLEYQDEILVIDCGLLFSDLEHFGVEFVIPDFSYLVERKEKIKGMIFTHGHEDHVGALAFALKAGIRAPIYASTFTTLLIRERLKEHGLESACEIRTFKMRDTLKFKHFTVKTESVNHSIVDSAALFIQTPVGNVVHTGDFKMDAQPFYGQELDRRAFGAFGDQGVLLLMSDSTNVERHTHSLSESVIYQKFEQLFAAAEGLTVVSMFASNVARMGQVFEVAKKLDKKIALSGRSMEQNVRLGMDAGYLKDAHAQIISLADLDDYPRNKVIVLSTGSQGEWRSSLARIAHDEHPYVKLQEGDLVMMSSKFIPGNEKAIGRMINDLFKQGAEVLYEAIHDIHTSGHATQPELREMIELVRPKYFIPIHGEYRHLVHHAKLARDTGMTDEQVLIAVNGDVIEVSADRCEIVDHIDEPRVLIEGREGNDVSKLVLKDRRQLGEKGVVFALMVRNRDSRRIISGPEIIVKGLVNESIEGWLIEEAGALAKKIINKYDQQIARREPVMDLQEEVRVELRRFFNANIGNKPVVLPIILDV